MHKFGAEKIIFAVAIKYTGLGGTMVLQVFKSICMLIKLRS